MRDIRRGGGRPAARGSIALAAAALCALALAACSAGGEPDGPPPPGDGDPPPGDGGGGGGGPEFPQFVEGDLLARLELGAPTPTTFVLRGTLPVPPGLYPLEEGWSPFAVVDPEGVATPAQVEIVSRYADAAGGADVVEVLAPVARPQGAAPGERLFYDVIWSPHLPAELTVHPAVQALLDEPQAVTLRTHDVFGHEYTADLLRDAREENEELRILRNGEVALQGRTHEIMLSGDPTGAPDGALPHFMGVHSYVTAWKDEQFFSLDIRVHNGGDGLDPDDPVDDPMGRIYFDALELRVPRGWVVLQAFDNPLFGDPYVEGDYSVVPLVEAIPGGDLHVIPPQSQLHRRLVVAREGSEDRARALLLEEGLGFCRYGQANEERELFSWWNLDTARYFPQKEPLARLDHYPFEHWREELADDFAIHAQALANGTPGGEEILIGNLGWAHPWGPAIGYMNGGNEIFMYDGMLTAWSASREGYRMYQVSHRMYTDRHPTALYDKDGEAVCEEDWIYEGPNGPVQPMWIWMIPWLMLGDPYGFGDAPTFQVDAVAAMGLQPDYEAALLNYEHIDNQHLIRYTRSPKVLAWLGNDALAKDDLRLQAELCRASYSSLPQDDYGNYIVTGMLRDIEEIAVHPRDGFEIDRGEGWWFDCAAAAFSLGDDELRGRFRPWFHELLELVEEGQMDCTGVLGSIPNPNHFGGDYRVRQSISEAILQNGLWGMRSSVFDAFDEERSQRLNDVLIPNLYNMISDIVWDDVDHAVTFYVALGPYDINEPSFCDSVPPDGLESFDNYQGWSSHAYGFRLTGDPAFLERAEEMLGSPLSTENLGAGDWPNYENRSALGALVQELWE